MVDACTHRRCALLSAYAHEGEGETLSARLAAHHAGLRRRRADGVCEPRSEELKRGEPRQSGRVPKRREPLQGVRGLLDGLLDGAHHLRRNELLERPDVVPRESLPRWRAGRRETQRESGFRHGRRCRVGARTTKPVPARAPAASAPADSPPPRSPAAPPPARASRRSCPL